MAKEKQLNTEQFKAHLDPKAKKKGEAVASGAAAA
jgi:hypothetical protein